MYRRAIAEWVQSRHKQPVVITDSVDLIETRLINSLDFLEFLLFLEDLSGKELTMDRIGVDKLRTIDSIMHHYFAAEVTS